MKDQKEKKKVQHFLKQIKTNLKEKKSIRKKDIFQNIKDQCTKW